MKKFRKFLEMVEHAGSIPNDIMTFLNDISLRNYGNFRSLMTELHNISMFYFPNANEDPYIAAKNILGTGVSCTTKKGIEAVPEKIKAGEKGNLFMSKNLIFVSDEQYKKVRHMDLPDNIDEFLRENFDFSRSNHIKILTSPFNIDSEIHEVFHTVKNYDRYLDELVYKHAEEDLDMDKIKKQKYYAKVLIALHKIMSPKFAHYAAKKLHEFYDRPGDIFYQFLSDLIEEYEDIGEV